MIFQEEDQITEGPLYVLRNFIIHVRMTEQIERTTGSNIETETQPIGWRKPEKVGINSTRMEHEIDQ